MCKLWFLMEIKWYMCGRSGVVWCGDRLGVVWCRVVIFAGGAVW